MKKEVIVKTRIAGLVAAFFMTVMLVVGSSSSMAFADGPSSTSALVQLSKSDTMAGPIASQIDKATNTQILTWSAADDLMYFDNDAYSQLDVNTKQNFMKTSLGYIRNSSLNTMSKNKLYNFVADQDTATSFALRNLQTDTTANVAGASAWYEPFSGTVSTILGLISLAVIILLGVTIVLDVAYISLPPIRLFLDRNETNERPRFVSVEAFASVRDAESSTEGYRSTLALYMKRRFVVLLLVSLCLIYLVSGQIFSTAGWLWQALSPITKQFGWSH